MEQEIWKRVPNSKSYAVSNFGRVKRLRHEKWNSLNQSYSTYAEIILSIGYGNAKGYGRIKIVYADNTSKVCGVHRLVCECFKENPNNLPQVNHKDGDKTNNHHSNLEWSTQASNMQHRIHTLGVEHWKKGEDSNFTILTEKQVRQIPIMLEQGKTRTQIAKDFNVVKGTITEITKGRSWKHLNLF